jgi:type II secretory pathway pseudopilin PulG
MKEMLIQHMPGILEIVYAIVGILAAALLKKYGGQVKENQAMSEAVEALRIGVEKAHEDFVEWAKRSAKDGKLSKEEREQARTIAINHALLTAKGPALKLLQTWGMDKLNSLIARIVDSKTDKGGPANVVITGELDSQSNT